MTRSRTGLAVALVLGVTTTALAATVDGRLTVGGAAVRDAVVQLDAAEGTTPPPPRGGRIVLDQQSLEFRPAVLPIQAGSTVEFHNSDDVQHNVFSPSRQQPFDLGTYGRGESRTVTFAEPGEVHVLCNIHMEMEARVLVLPTPWFATTDADGRFAIADVPPGRHRLRVWRRSWLAHEQVVDVPAVDRTTVDVVVP